MSLLSLRWSGEYELSPEQERARRFHQHVLPDVDYPKSISYNVTRFLAIIAQDGSAVLQQGFCVRAPRLLYLGIDPSKVEEPPAEAGYRDGLERLLLKNMSGSNTLISQNGSQ